MSSRMNGYRSDRGTDRERPSSEQLVDLHVYIVPPDIWREKFNNALNQNINDTVSVGLIRVHPETKVFVLRDEIEQQLGTEVIPREYVFLKSVGRSLTRLKSKQEYQMKAKHFLPPNAYAPEIYILEATPEVRAALAASSEGSTRPQTQTSLEYETYRPNYGPASEGQHLQTDKSSAMSSSVGVASSTEASTVGGGGARDVYSLQIQSPLPKMHPPTSYRQQQQHSPVGQSRTPPLELQPSSAQLSPPQHTSESKNLQPTYKSSAPPATPAPPATLTSLHDANAPFNFSSTISLHGAPHVYTARASVLPVDNMHVESKKNKPGMIHLHVRPERDGLDKHSQSTQKSTQDKKNLSHVPMALSAPWADFETKKSPIDVKRKPDENYIKIRQNAQLNLKEQSRRHQKDDTDKESYAQSRPYQEHVSTDQKPGYGHVGAKQEHAINNQTYSSKQLPVSNNNLQKLEQPGQDGKREKMSSNSQVLNQMIIPDTHDNFNVFVSESSYREHTQDSNNDYEHRTYHARQNVNTNSQAPVSSKVSPAFHLATNPPNHLGRRPYFKSPPVDVPPITSSRRDDYLPPLSATPPPPPPIASRAKHSRHESPAKAFDRPPSIVHNHINDNSGLAGYSPVNTYRENNDVLDRRSSSLKSDILQEKLIEKPEPGTDESREKRTQESEVIQEHYIRKPEPEVEEKRKRSPETEVIQEHFVEKPEPEREEKRKPEPEPQLIHQRHKSSRDEEEERQRQEQEEQRRREEEERRRREEERRRREEEERRRRDQEEHDHLDWEQQKREEEERRRHEEEARRRREDEERRRKEDEKEKYYEMNRMKSGSDDDLAKFPSPPPPPIGSPKTRQTSAERRRKKGEKEKLLRELEAAREARHVAERQREELVRKAKQMQSKTQSRRNHARDLWKKRYFDEKKKTIPLDEQCNKLRHELDIIHKKLISTLEGPKEKATKLQEIRPSPKNNYKIQATRLAHELEDLKRRVENSKMRLTGEMKLRNQAETELRALRAELTQKKINLTLSRNSHLTAFAPPAADIPFVTPRQAAITPRS